MARPSEHVFGDITIKVGTLAVGADANLGAAVGLALGGSYPN